MTSHDMHAAPCPTSLQALTPRQIRVLASAPDAHSVSPAAAAGAICNTGGGSTLREIEPPYQYLGPQGRTEVKRRLQRWVGELCVLPKVVGLCMVTFGCARMHKPGRAYFGCTMHTSQGASTPTIPQAAGHVGVR